MKIQKKYRIILSNKLNIIIIFFLFVINLNNVISKNILFDNNHKLSPFSKMLMYRINYTDMKAKINEYHNKSIDFNKLNQNASFQKKLSLNDLRNNIDKNFQFMDINNEIYIGVLLLTNGQNIQPKIEKLGGLIGLITKDVISIKVKPEDLAQIIDLEEVLYVQVDEKVGLSLDKVRSETKFDLLHNGTITGNKVQGEGVVVGIIDAGFDFTHSAFLMGSSNQNRISRAWVQNSNNRPPLNYSYGTEVIGSALSFENYDYAEETHGTHVTGIAAGNGYFNGNKHSGVAPGAEIVLVSPIFNINQSITTGQTNILDGINYIFNYAKLVNKPAVINMSLGTTIGPKDGTSLFNRACDNIVGRGKLIVAAAGNSGETNMHINQNFDLNNNPLYTVITQQQSTSNGGDCYVELWGEEGKDIEIEVGVTQNGNDNWLNQKFKASSFGFNRIYLTNKSGSQNLGVVEISLSASEFNRKPRIFLSFDNVNLNYNPIIRITSNSKGNIHLWNCGFGGSTGGELSNGDNNYTLLEIGGTGKSIISVASYTTKSSTNNLFNNVLRSDFPTNNGDFSPFSSKGPSVDNRVKPEISAPGSLIVSAFNSWSTTFSPNGNGANYVMDNSILKFKNDDYYGAFEGTSMASPVVTGTVALMLEVFPGLSPDEAMDIIKQTAINDNFTGNVKETGSPRWGYGKINIIESVKMSKELGKFFGVFPEVNLYPNPTSNGFDAIFQDTTSGEFEFTIYDNLGSRVSNKSVKFNSENIKSAIYFDMKEYSIGTYFLFISNGIRNKTYLFQKTN